MITTIAAACIGLPLALLEARIDEPPQHVRQDHQTAMMDLWAAGPRPPLHPNVERVIVYQTEPVTVVYAEGECAMAYLLVPKDALKEWLAIKVGRRV